MNAQVALQQAITAAKQQDWDAAVTYNQAILEINPHDVGAMNRLGVAYLQLGNTKEAKNSFEQVLAFDKSNSIAKKNLAKLNSNHAAVVPTFCQEDFIEEPGKTKTVELHRLAGKNILDGLAVGQSCELKPKSRYISVESSGIYIGALPEDVSFRLSKLIETGNQYSVCIRSFSGNHCSLYIKEAYRSPQNQDMHSFPPTKNNLAAINEVDEHLLFDDETTSSSPVETEVELDKGFTEYDSEEV